MQMCMVNNLSETAAVQRLCANQLFDETGSGHVSTITKTAHILMNFCTQTYLVFMLTFRKHFYFVNRAKIV